ncbi:MAG: hypothetical protein QW186_09530 [Candidatus Bathyarchaeia archaeon]
MTFSDLNYYWVKSQRNGRMYRLNRIERSFYRACLLLAKLKGVIVNSTVVSMLAEIIQRIESFKVKALRRGFERVCEMVACFKRSGVLNWAPCVRSWLREESYILYLGFMALNEPPRMPYG